MWTVSSFNQVDLALFLIILVISILALIITRKLLKVAFPYFFMGFLGIILGLVVGSLVSAPLARLPGDFGKYLPLVINVFVTVAILDLFLAQSRTVSIFLQSALNRNTAQTNNAAENTTDVIIDTSVLIDGRITAICSAGFIPGKIIIPRFVLGELQSVADAANDIKRARGRRGLEVIDNLQRDSEVVVEIVDDKFSKRQSVDEKLVALARARRAKILTLDYNLNRVAKIQAVNVLNINELVEALKPSLIPGETTRVKIIQKGKEKNQGVGYLTDGTMIVVEDGARLVGQEVECVVMRIFQTVAGKMIFVQPNISRVKTRYGATKTPSVERAKLPISSREMTRK